jgi:adenosylmethionine-8-amino-7-oxononanoate aminotransferase
MNDKAKDSTSVQPAWYRHGLAHIWLPYAQMKTLRPPLAVARTEGCRIVLADGRELVDGIASWWTACHGYNHPHIRAALERQLAVMPHVMLGGLVHEQAMTLARRLAALLPGDLDRVFFCESGSVAIEIALKMAVQYWRNRGIRNRKKIGFHDMFRGYLPEHFIFDLPGDAASAAALEAGLEQHAEELAAIIVEPLAQGAGGMRFHAADTLRCLRALADRYQLLLIFDEIFTGFGRTGSLFACEAAQVVPDIIALSKALTGGTLPLAATVARRKVFEAFWSDDPKKALMHGPTYMGNALACAAANASLDLFASEPRLQQVRAISEQMTRELTPVRDRPGVKDVRVCGAIGVVELERIEDLGHLRARFVAEGVFIRPFGNVVYLTPPFTIRPDELAALTGAIRRVLGSGA